MPPFEGLTLEQRFVFMERDVQSHAKTITAHNDNLQRINTEAIRREERDTSLDGRLTRMEKSIGDVYKLGWWILGAFGASFVALLANFLFKGGFVI